MLYSHVLYLNDTIIKTQGFERVVQRFACERELETEHN